MSEYVLGGVIAFSLLVAVHEFGHYIVARLCGVRVLAFSIGFGQVLWRRTDAVGTEWRISALPLGGYVKLLNRHTILELPEEERQHAHGDSIETKAWWQKISIVSAGPLINLLFAALLFACLHLAGNEQLRAVVGEVTFYSPAARAGVQSADIITHINGTPIESWRDVDSAVAKAFVDAVPVQAIFITQTGTTSRTLFVDSVMKDWLRQRTQVAPSSLLGLAPQLPPMSLTIERVMPNSPAANAGLRVEDRVVAVDGQPITQWQQLVSRIEHTPNQTLAITLERNGVQQTVRPVIGTQQATGTQNQRGYLGVVPKTAPHQREAYFVTVRHGLLSAVYTGMINTVDVSVRIISSVVAMVTGQQSLDGLGGPVAIVTIAGESFASGLTDFIAFMALLSISLGVFNLLPLPLLDGGYIVLYSLEAVRKKRLSQSAEQLFFRLGAASMLMLVMLALFNDVTRLLS